MALHLKTEKQMFYYRAGFKRASKAISRLLWFCIDTLCDWLKNLAPLYQPTRSETKTNRDFLARVFSRLAPVTHIFSISDGFIGLCAYVVIVQNNYFFFYYTQLKTALCMCEKVFSLASGCQMIFTCFPRVC